MRCSQPRRGRNSPGLLARTSVLDPGALSPDGGLNLHLGPLPLVVGLTLMALALRSRGLGFLAATAVGGLVIRQVLDFEVTGVDTRLLGIPYTLAVLGAVAALGALIRRARPVAARAVGGVALAALIAVPTAAPRLVSGVDIAAQGVYLGYPVVQDPEVNYANQTSFAASLRDEWRALNWMRHEMPTDARVLAENSPLFQRRPVAPHRKPAVAWHSSTRYDALAPGRAEVPNPSSTWRNWRSPTSM